MYNCVILSTIRTVINFIFFKIMAKTISYIIKIKINYLCSYEIHEEI
jgi:hypothetical protein